jgi:glycosyltransferase involved in cell wall biosynthesis
MDENLSAQGPGTSEGLQTIAALIPAHNARETIGAVVAGTRRHVGYVLVVDDGSEDGTNAEAAQAGAVVIRHLNNRGKGEALKTGFRFLVAHGFDAVLTLDADGQHNPDDIPGLISRFEEGTAGIVIGTRMADRAKIPRYRLIPNLVGNFFLSRASGQSIADSQCGMRLYAARVLGGVKIDSSRFDAEAELLIKVKDTYLICLVYLKSLFWKRN